jgi:hypothetical protein
MPRLASRRCDSASGQNARTRPLQIRHLINFVISWHEDAEHSHATHSTHSTRSRAGSKHAAEQPQAPPSTRAQTPGPRPHLGQRAQQRREQREPPVRRHAAERAREALPQLRRAAAGADPRGHDSGKRGGGGGLGVGVVGGRGRLLDQPQRLRAWGAGEDGGVGQRRWLGGLRFRWGGGPRRGQKGVQVGGRRGSRGPGEPSYERTVSNHCMSSATVKAKESGV